MARAESPSQWQLDRSKIDFTPEFPSIIAVAALILAALVDIYIAYQIFISDEQLSSIIAMLIIGAMIGLVMLALSQWGRGTVGSFDTNASSKEIHDEAVRLFAPSCWNLNGSTDTEIWYSIKRGPRLAVVVLLLLLGVFPAIVYLVVARNEQVAHIAWSNVRSGWTRVDVGVTPQNPHGREIAKWLHRQLGA